LRFLELGASGLELGMPPKELGVLVDRIVDTTN
jgi:hypothetical protein